MVQTWWQKLNANERMAATGAIVVFVVSLLATNWIGTNWIGLIGSAVVLAVYWLKYSPNKINWPAPVELINVVISGIIGLFAVIGLLFALGIGSFGFSMLGVGGGFFGGIYLLILGAAVAYAVGAGMMFLGTWREYQVMPKTAPPAPPSAPPPPPSEPPPMPPGEPPPMPPGEPPVTPPKEGYGG